MEMNSFSLTISLMPQEDMDHLQGVFQNLHKSIEALEGKDKERELKDINALQKSFGVKL